MNVSIKIESLQYNACQAFVQAMRGTSKENIQVGVL